MPQLAAAIGKSPSWIYEIQKKGIHLIMFGDLLGLSRVLEFDFVLDYYRSTGLISSAEMHLLREPEANYDRANKISIQVTVEGDVKNIGKVLQTLSTEGSKQGYKVGSVSQ